MTLIGELTASSWLKIIVPAVGNVALAVLTFRTPCRAPSTAPLANDTVLVNVLVPLMSMCSSAPELTVMPEPLMLAS